MGDFVELLFQLSYRDDPEFLDEVKTELLSEFQRLGASDVVLEQVNIELRQGSTIAKLTGPASVISKLRKMPLSNVNVKGHKATHLGQRITGFVPCDVTSSPMKIVFGGLAKKPPVPFMTAIADIGKENIIADVVDAAEETVNQVNLRLQDSSDLQDDPLDADSIAYIVKWCSEDTSPTIYQECTQRAYQRDRFKLLPFRNFYWGLVHAMAKIPPYKGAVVNRGVRVPRGFDMLAKHPDGREIVWWGPTSTTKYITDAQMFLGSDEEEAVIFQIELTQNQARDISKYNPAGEQEVLLPPGCMFKVKGTCEKQGIFAVISVEEIPSPHLIFNLAPATQVGGSSQAAPKSPEATMDFHVGDKVVLTGSHGEWIGRGFEATIMNIDRDADTIEVKYLDHGSKVWSREIFQALLKRSATMDYQIGQSVILKGDHGLFIGESFNATIMKINREIGTVEVKYSSQSSKVLPLQIFEMLLVQCSEAAEKPADSSETPAAPSQAKGKAKALKGEGKEPPSQTSEAPAEAKEALPVLRATFKPGILGIEVTDSTGEVTKVEDGSQAHQQGVQPTMRIHQIGGQNYSGMRLHERRTGKDHYEITFLQAGSSLLVSSVSPPHSSQVPPEVVDGSFPRPDVHWTANARWVALLILTVLVLGTALIVLVVIEIRGNDSRAAPPRPHPPAPRPPPHPTPSPPSPTPPPKPPPSPTPSPPPTPSPTPSPPPTPSPTPSPPPTPSPTSKLSSVLVKDLATSATLPSSGLHCSKQCSDLDTLHDVAAGRRIVYDPSCRNDDYCCHARGGNTPIKCRFCHFFETGDANSCGQCPSCIPSPSPMANVEASNSSIVI